MKHCGIECEHNTTVMERVNEQACDQQVFDAIRQLVESPAGGMYGLSSIKSMLVGQFGPVKAAGLFAEGAGWGRGWVASRFQVVCLYDYAKRYASTFELVSPSHSVTIPQLRGLSETLKDCLTATTRNIYFAVLETAIVTSKSNIVLCQDFALLDAEARERDAIAINLNVDSSVVSHGSDNCIWRMSRSDSSSEMFVPRALSLLGVHSYNFGHWITEFLPKLWLCMGRAGFDDLPILVDSKMPRQHFEALRYFVGDEHPVVEVEYGRSVTVGQLWVVPMLNYNAVGQLSDVDETYPFGMSNVDEKLYVELLKNAISVAGVQSSRRETPKYIYLRRKDTQHRKLVNRKEIESLLSRKGFAVVDFGDLDFQQQMELMQAAEIIVGPEGSSLFTTYFGSPGLNILWLTPPADAIDYEVYTQVCEHLEQKLWALPGTQIKCHDMYSWMADYHIDPELVTEWLKAVGYKELSTQKEPAFLEYRDIIEQLAAGVRPNLYGLRAIKKRLRTKVGVQKAANIYAAAAGWGSGWRARPYTVRGLKGYARKNALKFRELSAAKTLVAPCLSGFEKVLKQPTEVATRSIYFCCLDNATVISKSNLILHHQYALIDAQKNERDRIPCDLTVDSPVIHHKNDTVWIMGETGRDQNSTIYLERSISLLGVHSFNFGHWIMEFIPKVWMLLGRSAFEKCPILVDEQMPSQLMEVLRFFVGSEQPIVTVRPGHRAFVKELWVCSMPTYFAVGGKPEVMNRDGLWQLNVDAEFYVSLLRSAMERVTADITPEIDSPRRIYLRRDGLHKSLVNGQEIEQIFVDHGFESFDFYNLSFIEQVRLIRGAQIVAGPEGSSFHTTYFGLPGMKIIQLASPCIDGYEYYNQVCMELGQEHMVIQGVYSDSESIYDIHRNYTIQAEVVRAMLKTLG